VIKRIILSFFLVTITYFLVASRVSAALITVNPDGKLIWQVLGDSTIQIKKIAQNAVPSSDSQIFLKNLDGKVMLNGVDVTNLKETLVDVEARGGTDELKIGQDSGRFTLAENGVIANTNYPITIDPMRDTLSVVTPTGARLISVLPYEATLLLIRAKLVDKVDDNQVALSETQNGELQYSVSGQRHINLFNLTQIIVDIHSNVSATTGEILKLDEPQWLRIFGFLFA